MLKNISKIKQVKFEEPRVGNKTELTPFEITLEFLPSFPSFIIDGDFSHELYSRSLILTVFNLQKRKWPSFVEYQVKTKTDPRKWLAQFEDLLFKNKQFFKEQDELEFYIGIVGVLTTTIDKLKLLELNQDIHLKSPQESVTILDLYQIAILFDYLKEMGIILPYDNKSLARLLHHLTGHSEQNLRTRGLGNIYSIKVETRDEEKQFNLIRVKDQIETLLNKIKSDLK